jgi:hypothetical protein
MRYMGRGRYSLMRAGGAGILAVELLAAGLMVLDYWLLGYWLLGYWLLGYWLLGYWLLGYWLLEYWLLGYWLLGYWLLEYWLLGYGCPLVYKTHRKVNLSSYSRDLRSQFWQNWPPIRSILATNYRCAALRCVALRCAPPPVGGSNHPRRVLYRNS